MLLNLIGRAINTRVLTLTESDWATLRAFQPAMNEATALFKGDLTETEQRELSRLIARLDAFHGPIYQAHMTHKDITEYKLAN
ncbi:hypothetical protein [Spirosoma arcticum]